MVRPGIARIFTVLVLLQACTNIGLLDKLENPANAVAEKFTTNNYIFVSSWFVQGDMAFSPYSECMSLTGTARADCSCTKAAAANGLRKSAGHQFVAILSTGSPSIYDASCKMLGVPQGITCTSGDTAPWLNTAGETIAATFAGLFSATNLIAPKFTENGSPASTSLAWTGSNTSGTNSTVNCSNWSTNANASTGTAGNVTGVTGTWLSDGSQPTCDTAQRIYCGGRL